MRFATFCFVSVLLGAAIGSSLNAQQGSQPELVIQAANTAGAPAPSKPAVTADDPTLQAALTALKALQDAKTANAEVLKKQEATLQQLDEVQKAADQLRIFTKRG
jgi:hypothetical protein